jgi:hypothetical protein
MNDVLQQMKVRAPKKYKRLCDNRIERAYQSSCAGVQINIMDIDKVFQHGQRQIDMHGLDDAELAKSIREYVETIRQN